ncbi:hypothetical protein A2Z67_02600 [Candidatus Woesebacteria bacterium RBG_13_36_22]|uniref:Uncharacterized protein n=1 Tax=Candidatus Woesebacteria bacterium RBG_13_36_22 TaxID=1802478 RepID=A0A1F7X3J1_9BACT|nr:MAG: hypothetical protein A2Z67_02600 [Candidatus Woesebacteria bacterium RBG_13_36_22]
MNMTTKMKKQPIISRFSGSIIIEFKNDSCGLYKNRHLEIVNIGTQIRFYEVREDRKLAYCLKKTTIRELIKLHRLPNTTIIRRALKGDKSIFNK